MSKKYNRRTPEQKAAIVQERLVKGEEVTTLCKRHNITPAQYYQWQKDLFSGALFRDASTQRKQSAKERKAAEREERLNAKIADQKDVIAELLHDHYELKKSLGEL